MKKLFTAIAITAIAFLGTSLHADAGGHGSYHSGQKFSHSSGKIYVSGYSHGRAVYTQKYVIGYDRYGNPRFGYRKVSGPSFKSHGSSFRGSSFRGSSFRGSSYNRGFRSGSRYGYCR